MIDDKEYRIEPNGFIEVSRTEAHRLKTTYSKPVTRDGVGNDLIPQALELEFPLDENGQEMRYRLRSTDANKSMLDGKVYPNAEALKAHILANADRLDNREVGLKSLKKV